MSVTVLIDLAIIQEILKTYLLESRRLRADRSKRRLWFWCVHGCNDMGAALKDALDEDEFVASDKCRRKRSKDNFYVEPCRYAKETIGEGQLTRVAGQSRQLTAQIFTTQLKAFVSEMHSGS